MEEDSQLDDIEMDETFFCDKINLKMFAPQRSGGRKSFEGEKVESFDGE